MINPHIGRHWDGTLTLVVGRPRLATADKPQTEQESLGFGGVAAWRANAKR